MAISQPKINFMNKRYFFAVLVVAMGLTQIAGAQVIIGPRIGMGGRIYARPRPRQQARPAPKQNLPKFEPTVNLSIGYGFPNLDKNSLPQYYNAYSGNVSQNGPIAGSLDYQFSRNMSIGVLVTHGTVNAPYYDYSSATVPSFTSKLDNWAFMLNLVNYMPTNTTKVSPYLRTAIGVNSWTQTYTDANGNKAAVAPVNLPDLAYQVSLGAKFNLSKNAGLFVEAGYGKYILQGGLALKF